MLNTFFNYYLTNDYFLYESYNLKIEKSTGNYWILNCLFSLSSNTKGGAIYCTGSNIKLLIESTNFLNCSSSDWGGSICCYPSINSCILEKICVSNSISNIYYSFACIYSTNINNCNLTTIINCFAPSKTIQFTFGNQICFNSNLSKNNLLNGHTSGISFSAPSFLDSKFGTYFNNSLPSTSYVCIQLTQGSNSRKITFSNIINNNSPTYSIITICGGDFILENCTFFNNKNILFGSNGEGGNLRIYNCFINHLYQYGSAIYSNTFSYSSSYNLYHFNTFICNNILLKEFSILKNNQKLIFLKFLLVLII